jgi:endonuclease/exonuclease/phosphatase (EEP) superfamily protein YafD
MIKFARLLAWAPDALALAVATGCLLAAAAGQGGRFSARLDVLNHFAPFWFAGALAAAVYALVFASPSAKWAIVGLGGAGVVCALALILPELIRPIRPPFIGQAERQITLIQFNVWDQNTDVEATADWIAAQKPDVVLMQEVRQPIRDALIRRGFHHLRGLAHAGIFTPMTPATNPFMVPMGAWKELPDFARATFHAPAGDFSVISAHLVWPTNQIQAPTRAALVELLKLYPRDRLIVSGDFNLTPWSFALKGVDKGLGLERVDRAMFSWPARSNPHSFSSWPVPVLPIDHLYIGRDWRVVSLERGPRLGSDHYPLVARLALTQ